jgi:hypothetical protein
VIFVSIPNAPRAAARKSVSPVAAGREEKGKVTVITLAVVLFAAGVALLMMSSDFLTLYRSKVARELQGGAGGKGLATVLGGGGLVIVGVVLLVLRTLGWA